MINPKSIGLLGRQSLLLKNMMALVLAPLMPKISLFSLKDGGVLDRIKIHYGVLWFTIFIILKRNRLTTLRRNTLPDVWCNIYKAVKSLYNPNINPNAICSLVTSSDDEILFWKDAWLGIDKLQDRFPSLYALETMKRCYLSDRFLVQAIQGSGKVPHIVPKSFHN